MNEDNTLFEELKSLANEAGVAATLDRLMDSLRQRGDYHQLFEAMKMQIRHQLGLPLLYERRPAELDDQQQSLLEDGLLGACKEVGTLLVNSGKLREGWIYLQPVADADLTQSLIRSFQVTDDNLDEVIDISLMQLADPEFGFQLVLDRYGTCNAITTYDSSLHALDVEQKKVLAKQLVTHLHTELMSNLVGYLRENGVEVEEGSTLLELTRANKRLLAGAGPMTDATHLSSIMRIGRCLTDLRSLSCLAHMAEYGCQLAEPFHFPGDPPFERTYRDHLIFYRALSTGDRPGPSGDTSDVQAIEHAISFFDQKSRASASDDYNPVPDEVFVDLLVRLGRKDQAIQVSLERLSRREELAGIAPSVQEIACTPEHYESLEQHYRSQKDLLGFAVSILLSN